MTPSATARSPKRPASGSHHGPVRRPRRISGPGAPKKSGALVAAVAIPAPGIVSPRQRPARRSSPTRRPAGKPSRTPAPGAPGIALRAVDAFAGLANSAFLDRLIRGRLWIGLLAFSLIGIVAMQLLVLKLNTGIGRTLVQEATLQRENAQLGIEDSTYSAESRIASLAAAAGMRLAPAGSIHFVVASNADIARGAVALSDPNHAPTSVSSGASSTTGGESSASTTSESSASTASSSAEAQTSSAASSQVSGSNGEAGKGESSSSTIPGSGAAQAGAASAEPSSSPSLPSGTPTSAGGASQATTASPSLASAPTASGSPASSSAASGTQASGPGGGTQAGSQE
jgi:cell division protein FtsL